MGLVKVWERRKEPFRVSEAVSTSKAKTRKIERWNGGVRIEEVK